MNERPTDPTLTAPAPDLPGAGAGALLERLPFPRTWWVAPGLVLAGRNPSSHDDAEHHDLLARLAACGVRRVLNLQEPDEAWGDGTPFRDYAPLLAELAGRPVPVMRLPIPNMEPPTSDLATRALAAIDEAIAARELIYLHCWGGHGRTGTIAGCWLRTRGLTADEAFAHMQAARAHDPFLRDNHPLVPITAPQRAFVRGWEARI